MERAEKTQWGQGREGGGGGGAPRLRELGRCSVQNKVASKARGAQPSLAELRAACSGEEGNQLADLLPDSGAVLQSTYIIPTSKHRSNLTTVDRNVIVKPQSFQTFCLSVK